MFAYAACISFGYRSWTFGVAQEPTASGAQLFNIGVVAASVFLVLAVASHSNNVRGGVRAVLTGMALLWLASMLVFAAMMGSFAIVVYPASMLIAGVGAGTVMPYCYDALVGQSSRETALSYGAIAAGGMGCALIAEYAGPAVLLCFNSLFLLVGALLFWAERSYFDDLRSGSGQSLLTGKAKKRQVGNRFLVAAVCVLVVSVVYGLTHSASFAASVSRGASGSLAQGAGLLGSVLFLLYFGFLKKEPSAALFSVLFGVLGGAVILLPFLPGIYPVALYAFSSGLWKIILLILFYMIAITPALIFSERLVLLSLAYGLPRLGIFVGVGIADVFGSLIQSDSLRLMAISVAMLYVLLAVFWFVNSYDRHRAQRQADAAQEIIEQLSRTQGDAERARLEGLAQQYGLTKREGEVLVLLARGRDLAFICDELCLSRNTVKGYQKAIYVKIGVHSKQELIDLIH